MKLLLPFAVLAAVGLALNIAIAISMERPLAAAPSADAAADPSGASGAGIGSTRLARRPEAKSVACIACHHGIEDMHGSPAVVLGCADCHGGDATAKLQNRFPNFATVKVSTPRSRRPRMSSR